jgi:hypothetical protein
MNASTISFDLIFDNAGGILLQTAGNQYVHHYDDPAQAAEDVKAVLAGEDTAGWDGNEPECAQDTDDDQFLGWLRSNAVLLYDAEDIADIMAMSDLSDIAGWGSNHVGFLRALTGKEIDY